MYANSMKLVQSSVGLAIVDAENRYWEFPSLGIEGSVLCVTCAENVGRNVNDKSQKRTHDYYVYK